MLNFKISKSRGLLNHVVLSFEGMWLQVRIIIINGKGVTSGIEGVWLPIMKRGVASNSGGIIINEKKAAKSFC